MQQINQSNKKLISAIEKEKSGKCIICLEDIYQKMNIVHLFSSVNKICSVCLNKIVFINKTYLFNNYKIWVLYEYNDFMKNLIYLYKGCYDICLSEVFLHPFINKIRLKYKNYCIVYPPSSNKDEKNRGYNHIYEIIKYLKLPSMDLFYKTSNYKQSNQSFKNRKLVKKHIQIKDKKLIKDKILIVDDVITSGNTILTLINLLLKKYPNIIDIKILILCQNKQKMSLFDERKFY